MVEPIPEPPVLDPDRIGTDDRGNFTAEEHRSRAQQLDAALHQTCEYARQLWLDVARARQYLYDTLPPDPRDPSADRLGASPTGPDDDQGWERWIDAYSELTSVLVGPHGDSGFGVSEARSAAQVRRSAPDETLQSVQSRSTHGEAAPAAAAPADAAPADAAPAAAAPGAAPSTAGAPSTGVLLAKRVALAGLAVLAVRGLRAPRHGR